MERTTRRAVLGAIALAPVAAIPAATATVPSSRWTELLATYRKAEATRKAFDRDVYMPAFNAYQREADALPHHTMTYDAMGGRRMLTTQNPGDVQFARSFAGPRSDGQSPDTRSVRRGLQLNDTWHTDMLAFVAAADQREAERQSLHDRHGIDKLDERGSDLTDAECEALEAAIMHPVNTITELNEKIGIINETEGFELGFTAKAVTADIARLAASSAA
ncbi:hypothetical protein NX02_05385 [Sphingomonas sanxanigenens DSM 19645 = NX02]|uniref:Uncharacterized protein n=2 Tax=Sphingomonas sanxanigenens TaxID=397260 RepID=W0A6V1_9SPHN|nr:hypothetical protein NX02_05385 [Sphingomonas sanxanigenens DSM 19645 = NX02]